MGDRMIVQCRGMYQIEMVCSVFCMHEEREKLITMGTDTILVTTFDSVTGESLVAVRTHNS